MNLASDESLPPCKSGIEKGKFGGQWGREDCFIALLSADAARSALAIIAVYSKMDQSRGGFGIILMCSWKKNQYIFRSIAM